MVALEFGMRRQRPDNVRRFRAPAAAGVVALVMVAAGGRWSWIAGAGLFLAVLAVRIRAAYQAGRAAERARWLRLMHDTALQSLEAMAMASEADRDAPAETLKRVRAAARREAVTLRGSLVELTGRAAGDDPASLVGALTDVVAALPAEAPRVEVIGGEPAVRLSSVSQAALRDAARCALGNVVRHAAAGRVVIRVAESGAGVEIVVRDDGRGFDPDRVAAGFGIRQSIVARIREAGGDATVESWPGRGTRVRLWAPAEVTTTRSRRRPHR